MCLHSPYLILVMELQPRKRDILTSDKEDATEVISPLLYISCTCVHVHAPPHDFANHKEHLSTAKNIFVPFCEA